MTWAEPGPVPGDLKTLAVRTEGPVMRVRLNRPDTGNCIDEAMLDDLIAVLSDLRARPEVRVLVFSGAGPDFCLGGDREEIRRLAVSDPSGTSVRRIGDKARQLLEAMSASRAVTIACVHGRTVGAGLALAVHCDLRTGAEGSSFRLPELAVGLPMAWGGALSRLISEVGAARVRELILTADLFGAETAYQLSILHRVVPEPELEAAVQKWVKPVLRRPVHALQTTKILLHAYSAPGHLADIGLLDSALLAAAAWIPQAPAGR